MVTLGYRAKIDAAQRYLESISPDENIALLFHGDVDGCSSGAIVYRTLRHMGRQIIFPVFQEKGESLYSDRLRKRILARSPSRLIVLDMGSRSSEIVPGLSTMVIDHHKPEGIPPVDVFATSYGVEPPAPTALFTYQICSPFVPVGGLEWLAAVGTIGDLGADTDYEIIRDARDRFGTSALKETVSLVNAARRSALYDVPAGFSALVHADSPLDIAEGAVPESSILAEYRREVNAELKKARRTAPRISDKWALLPFSSAALVHPLVAISWTRRLHDRIVIAANYGYTVDNVHFSVRSAKDVNLIDELAAVRPIQAGSEYGHGHPRATGGILPKPEFQDFIAKLGFDEEMDEAA